MLEESGLTLPSPRLHGLLRFTNFKGNDWYMFVYTATEFSGELTKTRGGTLAWIRVERSHEPFVINLT
jgi:8-oxo-dGTP diphosphatase